MKIRSLLLILFILLVAGFVALNFAQILQPTALNFGFTEVQAPLGLVLLAMLAAVLIVFLATLVYQQTTHMMVVRRVTREASEQRTLADKAEASRFTELRHFLEQLEARQRTVIEQASNSLAASVGELEDKVERALGAPRV